jgi:large subunit ribosomal protein L3
MINTILGSKIKMGQTFVNGVRFPVTIVTAGPCIVTQIKEVEKDGYWAVQLGFGGKKSKNITKPMRNHLLKASTSKETPKTLSRFIREIRLEEKPEFKVGDQIKVSDIFSEGDKVSVTGTSKGKGFAGVVKRWHFAGGPKTHGQSDRWRAPGSIGQGTTPGRVYKGKHMAGRMGQETTKIKGLKVLGVNVEKNEIQISGPVPGTVGSLLILERIGESHKKEETHEEGQTNA